jgi:stearoyl-CoA desaturase (delta-9 desaturase)
MKFNIKSAVHTFDTDFQPKDKPNTKKNLDGDRCFSLIFLHAGCLGVIWVGWSWFAIWAAVFLYFSRMFAITGFLHRYFSHRTFKTSRLMQFLFAAAAGTAAQRGALWWAAHHRKHHKESDNETDVHSPHTHSFLWSHIGWIASPKNFATDYDAIRDFAKYPELVYLNRFNKIVPLLLGVFLYFLGDWVAGRWPGLETSGWQMVIWGFFISTTVLFHGTQTINSLAHIYGRRRFDTPDHSKNNFWLALITLGEGWHNNHHYYMHSTRQGFYWWEIDLTYYGLKIMSWLGLVSDLKPVPARILEEGRKRDSK